MIHSLDNRDNIWYCNTHTHIVSLLGRLSVACSTPFTAIAAVCVVAILVLQTTPVYWE